MIKISVVSYTNSIPFIYGLDKLKKEFSIDISLDYPSLCADKLMNNQVDIGLVPVAIIPELKNARIISDYCIGADGAVSSVLLVSNSPVDRIKNIYLDYQSKTSISLCRILASEFWNIKPKYLQAGEHYIQELKSNEAAVVIGDRAFEAARKFKHVVDLSLEWKKYTGLPFVFACWVTTNNDLSKEFLKSFNDNMAFGIENREKAISIVSKSSDKDFLTNYVNRFISYNLDENKQKALETFWHLMSKYQHNSILF
jgi:chorismate dehydratase